MSDFAALMNDLKAVNDSTETLAKAIPAEADTAEDDAAIAAAAAAAEATGAAADDEDAPVMTKSIKIGDQDIEVIDPEALVKSITDLVGGLKTESLAAFGVMAKALKSQGDLIKSLSDRIASVSAEGKGRKTTLAIIEKPAGAAEETLTKSTPAIDEEVFFAKALSAQEAGVIPYGSVALFEAQLNRGEKIAPASIAAVMGFGS